MSNIVSTISEVLKEKNNQSYAEITALVDTKLSEMGMQRMREDWDETRVNQNCNNAGNIEARTCHRVNHGDGTYSETWCNAWHCL